MACANLHSNHVNRTWRRVSCPLYVHWIWMMMEISFMKWSPYNQWWFVIRKAPWNAIQHNNMSKFSRFFFRKCSQRYCVWGSCHLAVYMSGWCQVEFRWRGLMWMSCLSSRRYPLCWKMNTFLNTWWRHQMETFSALLAICAGNSPVPGECPAQRPVTRNFDVFFDLRLNKRLSKQS